MSRLRMQFAVLGATALAVGTTVAASVAEAGSGG